MSDLNAALVQDWILREMVANGIVEKVQQSFLFYGEHTDYLIEVQATPIRKNVRLKENAPDFGDPYTRGYD